MALGVTSNEKATARATGVEPYDFFERDVRIATPSSVTTYLFAHPTTLSTSRQNGERQIFVPLSDGYYYGMFLGTKTAANMVPSAKRI